MLELRACFGLLASRMLLGGQERQELAPDLLPALAVWGDQQLAPFLRTQVSAWALLGSVRRRRQATARFAGEALRHVWAAKQSCYLGFRCLG